MTNEWLVHYNEERSYESLNNLAPKQVLNQRYNNRIPLLMQCGKKSGALHEQDLEKERIESQPVGNVGLLKTLFNDSAQNKIKPPNFVS